MPGTWTLAASYLDFMVWKCNRGRNSWQLCCYDAGTDEFTKLTLPGTEDTAYLHRIEMVTKNLAIILLSRGFWQRNQIGVIWAVDIYNPNQPLTAWRSPTFPFGERWDMRVANGQLFVRRSANIPTIEIWNGSNGSLITKVDFPNYTAPMKFGFFPDENQHYLEVGQELTMMPISGKCLSGLQFLMLKSLQIVSVDPPINKRWMRRQKLFGNCFMVSRLRTYKFIRSCTEEKQDFLVPERAKPYNFAEVELMPKGGIAYTVNNFSGACIALGQMDEKGQDTFIKFGRPMKMRPKTNKISHGGTLISHSSDDTSLKFFSISADQQLREVLVAFEPPSLEGFRLFEIWCLPTAAVAKFYSGNVKKTVFVAINFKPL